MRRFINIIVVGVLLFISKISVAQQGADGFTSAARTDISLRILRSETEKQHYIDPGWLDKYNKSFIYWRDCMFDTKSFALIMEYRALYQRATAGDDPKDASGGDLAFRGTWYFDDTDTINHGLLGFILEQRHRYGSIPPQSLAEVIGVLGSTSGSFDEEPFTFSQLWYEHHWLHDKIILRVGKIDLESIIDTYDFKDEDLFFMNDAYATNLSIPIPQKGLGAIFQVMLDETYFLNFGVADLNSRHSSFDVGTTRRGELVYIAEVGAQPCFDCLGNGKYHVDFWYASATKRFETPSGRGFSISLQQAFNKKFTAFLRYGYSHNEAAALRHMLQAGFGINGPFRIANDTFGLAATYEHPSDQDLREQEVFEAFYSFQVTNTTEITPDVQVILHPVDNLGQDVITVFSLRMFITLG